MKKILITLALLITLFTQASGVQAANAEGTITGSTTVKVGNTVSIKVTIKGSKLYMIKGTVSSSDSSILAGSGSIYKKADLTENENGFSSVSTTVTFTAKKSGNVKIKFTPDSGNCLDVDSNNVSISISSLTITVKEKETSTNSGTGTSNNNAGSTSNNNEPVEDTRSKENSLSSLKVSEGTLSPAFNASTTKYKVEVGSTVNKITLSATAKDSKASVSGTGEKTLKVGNNSFEIKCKAENGSVKTYKIDVHVDETPLVYTEYNGKKLGVVRTDVTAPNGFEKTTVTLEGEKVTAFHSNQLDKTVVYLIDEQNNKNYYLFDEEKGITSIFIPTTLLGRNVYIIDVNENDFNKEGMIFGDITVDGNSLKGWTYEDPIYANYELIIVMNEQGEKVIYQHEKTENSLQLYMTPQKSNDNSKIIYVLAGTTGLFALTTLFFAIKYFFFKNKKIKEIKNFYEKRTPETKQPE